MQLHLPTPLAWAVAKGRLYIVNKTISTPHRGLVSIVADPDVGDYVSACGLLNAGGITPPSELSIGHIGDAKLIDVVQFGSPEFRLYGLEGDPFAKGPWCWLIDDSRAADPPAAMPVSEPRDEAELESVRSMIYQFTKLGSLAA